MPPPILQPRRAVILIAAVVVGIVGAVGLWGVSGYRPATLNVAVVTVSSTRTALLSVFNTNSRPFVLWQPFYVERQQDKSIVVGTGRNAGSVIRGGTGSGPSSTTIPVTLTGSDRGKWRLVASVSGYGLLGQVDALVKKPPGWTLKSPVVRFVLRRFARTATSDWLEERPSVPFFPGADNFAFRELLQSFQAEKGRWPTNHAEVREFAVSKSQPGPAPRFDDAVMQEMEDGTLRISIGQGFMTLSKSSGPSWSSPGALTAARRMAEMRAASQGRREDSSTFAFVVRNFESRYKRWPRDMEELQEFAGAHLQPALPKTYEQAEFHTQANGGLLITHPNGRMTLGGSSSPAQQIRTPAEVRADADKRMDEMRMSSLVGAYQLRFQRWPSDMQEVNAFARTNQPRGIPERFDDAEFQPQPHGRLKIAYQKGREEMIVSGFGQRPIGFTNRAAPNLR